MKLRNKKTGEIVDLVKGYIKDSYYGQKIEIKPVAISNKEGYVYSSLAELNEEWEDYEEPEEYWFINDLDGEPMKCELRYCPVRDFADWSEKRKKIGNYFDTREEAERAMEKLKAWKRLKDGGFIFCGKGDCLDTIKFDYGEAGYNNQDFNLLFGGEE